ncbi:MAG: hypothetical protein WA197_08690 [Candidatus Acidiferrales bacterium]
MSDTTERLELPGPSICFTDSWLLLGPRRSFHCRRTFSAFRLEYSVNGADKLLALIAEFGSRINLEELRPEQEIQISD